MNKPNKWAAALLGLVLPPVGLMYVARLKWAGFCLLAGLALGAADVLYLRNAMVGMAFQSVLAIVCSVCAYRFARSYPDDRPRPMYSRWWGLLAAIAGAVVLAFGVRSFLFEPFRFPSGSMLPTIPPKAVLIVQKWGYGNHGTYGVHLLRTPMSAPLERGDVIVFEFPPNRSFAYAKRLIGLPGDKVEYKGKKLSINGVPVDQRPTTVPVDLQMGSRESAFVETLNGVEYTILVDRNFRSPADEPAAHPFQDRCQHDAEGLTCLVPEGHYFTLGDQRDNSLDSRQWGFVPASHIIGKVVFIAP